MSSLYTLRKIDKPQQYNPISTVSADKHDRKSEVLF